MSATERRARGVLKVLEVVVRWPGDWVGDGVEGGMQPSTARLMAVSSAMAAASRCCRIVALQGISAGEERWSWLMSWMMVESSASCWQCCRESLQVRRRSLVAGVRAESWRVWYRSWW